jgi:predicted ArsR family transcriptional regulator
LEVDILSTEIPLEIQRNRLRERVMLYPMETYRVLRDEFGRKRARELFKKIHIDRVASKSAERRVGKIKSLADFFDAMKRMDAILGLESEYNLKTPSTGVVTVTKCPYLDLAKSIGMVAEGDLPCDIFCVNEAAMFNKYFGTKWKFLKRIGDGDDCCLIEMTMEPITELPKAAEKPKTKPATKLKTKAKKK